MVSGDSAGDPAVDDAEGSGDVDEELSRRLQRIKQRGCNVLVTKSTGGPAVDLITARLLGSPREERYRILVMIRDDVDALAVKFPGGVSILDDETHLIDYREELDGDDLDPGAFPPPEGEDPLVKLRAELENRMADCLSGRELEAAQLRVGVDSLGPLLERYPTSRVSEFVTDVTSSVREADGMGHFHVAMSDERARELPFASAFDVRIELRQIQARPAAHRIHLPEYGASDWMYVR